MTADLTLADARADRDALAGRTDVLDKVGVLATLPDDMHVTTDMVAEFYAVNVDAIRYHVKANRDELESDGYRVLGRPEFESEFGSLSNLDPRSRSIGIYPRRAVLRVGMLLRDSDIARRVRDYLLTVEHVARTTDDQIIEQALHILRRRNDELVAANAELRAENKELGQRAEVADKILTADGDLSIADTAKTLTRAGIKVGQNRLFTVLADHYKWIYRAHGDGRWHVKQTAIETGYMSVIPQSHFHPRTGVLVLDAPQPRVTPKGLQRLLVDHGATS